MPCNTEVVGSESGVLKAFFVVGNALDENPLIRVGVLNKKEMQTYRDLGAVGVICGRFYDKEGMPVVADVVTHQ